MQSPWLRRAFLGAVALSTACSSEPTEAPADMAMATITVGKRASKSGTIAITDDESRVVMVNPDDDSISVFLTADNSRSARVQTGDEPWAVVLHPDNTTAFVANRAAATVVKVTGINTANPTVSAPLSVGSEPSGLALSPSGRRLFVAEWAESRISVIDTTTMTVTATIPNIRNPRALAVTNNLDMSEDDELLIAPEFYGDPQPDGEAKDTGRKGRIHLYSLAGYTEVGTVGFDPLTAAEAGFGVATAPNQLGAVAISAGKFYVPSVSASPEGPPTFNNNVNPVVYVGDLSTKAELKGGVGTNNLAKLVNTEKTAGATGLQFLSEIVDIDFVPQSSIAYVVSRGADVVQRVDYTGPVPKIGSTQNKQIDVFAGDAAKCQNPTGIAIAAGSSKAYVNCWISRRLGVIDLNGQVLSTAVISTDPAPAGLAAQVQRGKRFFFTGRGRWSAEGWSSCGSCHPDGLSDNITWLFGSGPRQSTSLDGSYSKGSGTPKQRIFNWSAIIDEMHDFEANTRGTSGGKGAITSAMLQTDCGDLTKEVRVGTDVNGTLPAALGVPTAKELMDGTAGLPATGRCVKDWDDIDEYVKTVRPPRARQGLDAASVSRGAALFGAGKGECVKCHGGSGWTVSKRFYTPSSTQVMTLINTATFTKPTEWPAAFTFHATRQIAAQPTAAEISPFNVTPVGPPQLACAIRNVGTFGVSADATKTDALEKKSDMSRAQGRGGYNVPSLYGLALGGPYLHHGQAKTLEELFGDARFQTHWQAGSANFLTAGNVAQDRTDLINFLLSIDARTPEQAVPQNFDGGCSLN